MFGTPGGGGVVHLALNTGQDRFSLNRPGRLEQEGRQNALNVGILVVGMNVIQWCFRCDIVGRGQDVQDRARAQLCQVLPGAWIVLAADQERPPLAGRTHVRT